MPESAVALGGAIVGPLSAEDMLATGRPYILYVAARRGRTDDDNNDNSKNRTKQNTTIKQCIGD